jgi:hypothetical protein
MCRNDNVHFFSCGARRLSLFYVLPEFAVDVLRFAEGCPALRQ